MLTSTQQQAEAQQISKWIDGNKALGGRVLGDKKMLQAQQMPVAANFDMELAKSLVPLRSMTESHLEELINNSVVSIVFEGQVLFEQGAYDGQTLFCHPLK